MHAYNRDRILSAASKGRNPATAADVDAALRRPESDPWYDENCADAWADHRGEDPAELYCEHGTACDSVDLTAANIGPAGDLQCRDCNAVDDAKELAFNREHADFF